jgi:hypothetical protein
VSSDALRKSRARDTEPQHAVACVYASLHTSKLCSMANARLCDTESYQVIHICLLLVSVLAYQKRDWSLALANKLRALIDNFARLEPLVSMFHNEPEVRGSAQGSNMVLVWLLVCSSNRVHEAQSPPRKTCACAIAIVAAHRVRFVLAPVSCTAPAAASFYEERFVTAREERQSIPQVANVGGSSNVSWYHAIQA